MLILTLVAHFWHMVYVFKTRFKIPLLKINCWFGSMVYWWKFRDLIFPPWNANRFGVRNNFLFRFSWWDINYLSSLSTTHSSHQKESKIYGLLSLLYSFTYIACVSGFLLLFVIPLWQRFAILSNFSSSRVLSLISSSLSLFSLDCGSSFCYSILPSFCLLFFFCVLMVSLVDEVLEELFAHTPLSIVTPKSLSDDDNLSLSLISLTGSRISTSMRVPSPRSESVCKSSGRGDAATSTEISGERGKLQSLILHSLRERLPSWRVLSTLWGNLFLP